MRKEQATDIYPSHSPIDPKRLRMRMVRQQLEARGITHPGVLRAMSSVPRHLFVPEALAAHAYNDSPLPIGFGQTISQPFIVAYMSQHLLVEPGMRVLEIGAGCGYQAAILAAMGCTVHGVERLPEICAATAARLKRLGIHSVHMHKGDGTLGLRQRAPFDRVIVSAAGPAIPAALVDQLCDNGIMLMPVGPRQNGQRLKRAHKIDDNVNIEDLGGVAFVDLIGDQGWDPDD